MAFTAGISPCANAARMRVEETTCPCQHAKGTTCTSMPRAAHSFLSK